MRIMTERSVQSFHGVLSGHFTLRGQFLPHAPFRFVFCFTRSFKTSISRILMMTTDELN